MAHPLIAVAGPTASGKSDLALFLAARYSGEIVNCDSLQIYRGFDIGTAKSVASDVPHHLFDILDPSGVFTAGEYARRATRVLREVASRGSTPILVGGTGFYLRALIDGLSPAPQRNDALRDRLNQRDGVRLHRMLHRLDADSAARIHPNDKPKLIRALEICFESRRPMSQVIAEEKRGLVGFQVTKLGLNPPRTALYERINERTRRMYERGLVEEVRNLLASGVSPDAKPFEAPGYTEALTVVQEKMELPEAIDLTQRRTRQYAKRQTTWFRRERDMKWLNGFGDDPAIQRQAAEICDAR